MRLFQKVKDGGSESPVDAYFLIEWKGLFSIALLKFNKGGRDNFHTHAFHALTWFIKGDMVEEDVDGSTYVYKRSFIPKLTKRSKNHRIKANKDSWCITFRGNWREHWSEYNKEDDKTIIFEEGREVVTILNGIKTVELLDKE